MENLFTGIIYVIVRMDEILVSGKNDLEHLRNLEEVLKRLLNAGLRLKKCFHGTRGDVVWTQGHNRGCHASESKCMSNTGTIKTSKYQPVDVLFRDDKL